MIILPAMAFAAAVVYAVSGFIGKHFSPNLTSVIDLILFVTLFVAMHSLLRRLRDG